MKVFIYWFIYAFFGWIAETLYTSIPKGSFQDRGFLTMPIIPIYGFGAIIAVYVLKPISNNMVSIFIWGFFLTSLLEYITSFVMEKFFHMRWWDYSDRKFNIKGRVCLRNSLLFGILSVLLVKLIHPFFSQFVEPLSGYLLNNMVAILGALVFFDFLHAILFSFKFSKVFAELNETKESYASSRKATLMTLEKSVKTLKSKVNHLEHRLLVKYPVLKEDLHDMIEEIKEIIERS